MAGKFILHALLNINFIIIAVLKIKNLDEKILIYSHFCYELTTKGNSI